MNKAQPMRRIKPLDKIFGDQNPSHAGEKTQMIKVEEIYDFPGHTFEIYPEDDDFQFLQRSIRENGIESPLNLMNRVESGYYCVSGHRRKTIAVLEEIKIVPAIIRNYDPEAALDYMILSNLTQRKRIRPSGWVACILAKMDQAKKKSITESGKVSEHIAEELPISPRSVETHLHLQGLHENWMKLLNNEQFSLKVGEKLVGVS